MKGWWRYSLKGNLHLRSPSPPFHAICMYMYALVYTISVANWNSRSIFRFKSQFPQRLGNVEPQLTVQTMKSLHHYGLLEPQVKHWDLSTMHYNNIVFGGDCFFIQRTYNWSTQENALWLIRTLSTDSVLYREHLLQDKYKANKHFFLNLRISMKLKIKLRVKKKQKSTQSHVREDRLTTFHTRAM